MENETVKITCPYDAPVSMVWKALTEKDRMKKWYFDLKDFIAEEGFVFSFLGGPSPDRQYTHICEVTESILERKLSYTWKYEGYEGISMVSFAFEPIGNTTCLILTHKDIGTFPFENPDFDISNFKEGWSQIINSSLKNYLEEENRED